MQNNVDDLFTPRFTQPEVLQVTGMRADVLQTWINRKIIALPDHSPGTGRRRLYAPIHIINLKIMWRLNSLYGVAPTAAARLCIDATGSMEVDGSWERSRVMVLKPFTQIFTDAATGKVIEVREYETLHVGILTGDPQDITLKEMARMSDAAHPEYPDRPDLINGADSMLVLRTGEIIHSVLTQLEQIASRNA